MLRLIPAIGLLVLLGACAGEDDAGAPLPVVSTTSQESVERPTATTGTAGPATSTTSSEGYDPYQEFIALGGAEVWARDGESCVGLPVMCGPMCCSLISEDISPEDAQSRALAGCGTEWAPGTIDGLLAEAYRRVEGFCGASS